MFRFEHLIENIDQEDTRYLGAICSNLIYMYFSVPSLGWSDEILGFIWCWIVLVSGLASSDDLKSGRVVNGIKRTKDIGHFLDKHKTGCFMMGHPVRQDWLLTKYERQHIHTLCNFCNISIGQYAGLRQCSSYRGRVLYRFDGIYQM